MFRKLFARIEFRRTQIWFWLAPEVNLVNALEYVFDLIPGMLEDPTAHDETRTRMMAQGFGGLSCEPIEGNRVTLYRDDHECEPLQRPRAVVRVLAAINGLECTKTDA